MKSKTLFGLVGAVLLSIAGASSASAMEVDTVFVRAKGGVSFYSELDPVSMAGSIGLDLGFRSAAGFGLMGVGRFNFETSDTEVPAPNTIVNAEVKTVFLGVLPTYSLKKGAATLSFGLGAGSLSVTSKTNTTVFNVPTTFNPDRTRSRFALIGTLDADFEVFNGAFFNVGVQYIASMGATPRPGIISPMAGLGYRF